MGFSINPEYRVFVEEISSTEYRWKILENNKVYRYDTTIYSTREKARCQGSRYLTEKVAKGEI